MILVELLEAILLVEPLGLIHLDEFNILKIKDIGKLYDPCPTFLMNQMHEACSSLLATITITNSNNSPVLFSAKYCW